VDHLLCVCGSHSRTVEKIEIVRALYETKKLFLISKLPRVEGDQLNRSQVIVVKYPKTWAWFPKSALFEKGFVGTSNQQNFIIYKT